MSSNATLRPGTRLNRYEIEKRLAAGGFGVVYRGHRDDGRRVAIKEFLPSMLECRKQPVDTVLPRDPANRERFRSGLDAFFHEADTLSQIHDPRIISILDVFRANGTAYFAMPLESGYTFQAFTRAKPRPSERALVGLFAQAARGVEVLHAHGLLHLDLKPGNLWLRPNGEVVVLDLGASRWQDEHGSSIPAARTPGFAAPEQHGGSGKRRLMDIRTDVYGLAATLRACLTGIPPLPAPLRTADDIRVEWAGEASPRLLALIHRGTALDPAHRFPSMTSMRKAMEGLLHLPASPRHDQEDDGLR